jgi:hypothetical protein
MNTISSGKANADGIINMWIDENPVIERTQIVYRTGQQPTKKWAQIVLAPYIGAGSPKAQSMWWDELTVNTNRPKSAPTTSPGPPLGLPLSIGH